MKRYYWHIVYRKGNQNDKKVYMLGTYESRSEAREVLERNAEKHPHFRMKIVKCSADQGEVK